MKDIKTKQKVLSIKTKDVKGNVNHFIKQQTIHTRNKEEDKKVEQSVKTNRMYKLRITLVKLLSRRL